MKIGTIDQMQWSRFAPLLLPVVTNALEQGEKIGLLGLTEEDVACGAAAYYMDGNRLQILSIYVAPNYRERGGGSLLLTTLARLARRGTVPAYEMALDFSATTEEHRDLVRFLEHMGYQRRISNEGNFYHMSLEQMLASPYNRPSKEPSKDVVPFQELSSTELHLIQHHAVQSGLSVLPVKRLTDPEVEPDVSCVLFKNGIAVAFLLFQKNESKLELSCAWDGAHQAQHIPKMLRYAVCRLREKYPPETQVVVYAVNGVCENLVLKLVPDVQPVFMRYHKLLD